MGQLVRFFELITSEFMLIGLVILVELHLNFKIIKFIFTSNWAPKPLDV